MTNTETTYHSVEIGRVDLDKLEIDEPYFVVQSGKINKQIWKGWNIKNEGIKFLTHILLSETEYRQMFPESSPLTAKTDLEAIHDVCIIARKNDFEVAKELIEKQFVIISKQDVVSVQVSPQKESEWVSVEERLPEIDDSVLVAIKHRNGIKIEHDWYDKEFKRWAKLRFNDIITHWMPLPTPPQQK